MLRKLKIPAEHLAARRLRDTALDNGQYPTEYWCSVCWYPALQQALSRTHDFHERDPFHRLRNTALES
jgi:hypothetical protein